MKVRRFIQADCYFWHDKKLIQSNVQRLLLFLCAVCFVLFLSYTDSDILQHLSEAHLQNPMAGEGPKWRSVGASGTGTSGQADTAEEVGLNRTHPQEASIQHRTPSPDLEPAGEEEERPASQQLEARHWGRAETRDHLDWNGQSSPVRWRGVVDGLRSVGSQGVWVRAPSRGTYRDCIA